MKNKTKKQTLIYTIIAVIVVIAIMFIFYFNIKTQSSKNTEILKNNDSSPDNNHSNLIVNLEWREPSKITPTSGRYPLCPDGNNKGKIWMDLTIKNIDANVYLVCKDEATVFEESKSIDTVQWNIGYERQKSGFASDSRELKKKHIIKVCCSSTDKTINFCEEFSLEAYC